MYYVIIIILTRTFWCFYKYQLDGPSVSGAFTRRGQYYRRFPHVVVNIASFYKGIAIRYAGSAWMADNIATLFICLL